MAAQLMYQTRNGAGIVRVVRTVEEAEQLLQHVRRPARLVDARGNTVGGIERLDSIDAAEAGRKWGWWLDAGAFEDLPEAHLW